MRVLIRELIDKGIIRANCFLNKSYAARELEVKLELMIVGYPAIFTTICREVYGKPNSINAQNLHHRVVKKHGLGNNEILPAMLIILTHFYDLVEPKVMEHLPDLETLMDHKNLEPYEYCMLLYETIKMIEERPTLLLYYEL